MTQHAAKFDFVPDLGEHTWEDRLRRGIWPRSKIFWLAMLYLALSIIRPWEVIFPELGEFRFERIVGLTMVGLLALSQKWQWRGGLQAAAAVVFVFVMCLSSRFAYRPELSEPDINEFITILISFFVILFVVRTPYQLVFCVACFVVTMAIYVTKSEWEYFVNGAAQYRMGVRRLVGIDYTYGHPNQLAASILYCLPFAYFLFDVRHDFTAGWPRLYRRLFPIGLSVFAIAAVSGLFLTRSRAGIIGLVAFAFLVAVAQGSLRKKVRRVICVIVVMSVTFLFLPQDMQGRIQTMWDSSVEQGGAHQGAHTSAMGRYYGFLMGMEMFQRHPILGVGLGNFKEYRVNKLDGEFLSAHNLLGELLGEAGLLGAGAFAFVIGVLIINLRECRRVLRELPDTWVKVLSGLRVACRNTLLLLLLQGVTGHNLQRYNWFWIAAFSWLTLQFACELQRREFQTDPDAGTRTKSLTNPAGNHQALAC